MNELQTQLEQAIAAMDWDAVIAIAQQLDTMTDDPSAAGFAKMARAMAAAGKAMPPKPAADAPLPVAPPVAKLAASRDAEIVAKLAQLGDAERGMVAATRAANMATVRMTIALNRDAFDASDEREHLGMADPAATDRHVASFARKVKAGTIALSKPVAKQAEGANGAAVVDAHHGLSLAEREMADKEGVGYEAFAKSKTKLRKPARAQQERA